nr:hypothetical protein WG33_0322 [uncultured bacterium]
MHPERGQTALAWIVVLTIVAVGSLFLIISAFSQDTATTTVDGDRAVYSQYFDEDQ